MKIYKYKDISKTPLEQLYQSILENKFWCSNLVSLNDKEEFRFRCDCTPTKYTAANIEMLWVVNGNTRSVGLGLLPPLLDDNNYLERIASSIIKGMIDKARMELGLACFSLSKHNRTMWERYGGRGNGLCIEIVVPDITPNLFRVNYVKEKVIHIDTLMEACFNKDKEEEAVRKMLLTKTLEWQTEDEVRFVTIKPDILMPINGSVITEVMFGKKVEPEIFNRMKGDISNHPCGGSIMLKRMT